MLHIVFTDSTRFTASSFSNFVNNNLSEGIIGLNVNLDRIITNVKHVVLI